MERQNKCHTKAQMLRNAFVNGINEMDLNNGDQLNEEEKADLIHTVDKMIERECGELSIHSDKDIVTSCIRLMQSLVDAFAEYLRWVEFEPDSEEEIFSYGFYYSEIVNSLLLSNTWHSGGTSTRRKCNQLGLDGTKEIKFTVLEDEAELD